MLIRSGVLTKVSLVFGGRLRDEVDSSGGDDDDAFVSNACSYLNTSSFRSDWSGHTHWWVRVRRP